MLKILLEVKKFKLESWGFSIFFQRFFVIIMLKHEQFSI